MKNKTLIFIHVPKTAGTSFYHLIEENYSKTSRFVFNINKGKNPIPRLLHRAKRDNIEIIYGHGTYGLHEIFPNSEYLTFVREPVSHVISSYNYIKTNPHSRYYHQVKELSFKQFVQSLKELHTDNLHYRQFTNTLFRIEHPEYYEKEIQPDIDYLEYVLKTIRLMYRFDEIDKATKIIAEKFSWRASELTHLNVSEKVDFEIDAEDIEQIRAVNYLDWRIYERTKSLSTSLS